MKKYIGKSIQLSLLYFDKIIFNNFDELIDSINSSTALVSLYSRCISYIR